MLNYLSKVSTVWAAILALLAILVAGGNISISANVECHLLRPCLVVDLEKFRSFYKLKNIPKPLEFLITDLESKVFLINSPSLFDFPQNHPFSRTKTFSLLKDKVLMSGANPEGFLVPNTINDTKSILGLGHKTQNIHKQEPIGNEQLRAATFMFTRNYLVRDYYKLEGKETGNTLQLEEIEKIVSANYTKEEDKLAFWNALRLSTHYVNFINVENVSKVRASNVKILFDNSARYSLKPLTVTGLRFGQLSYDPKWNIVSIFELAPSEQIVFVVDALSVITSSNVDIRTEKFGEIDKNKLLQLLERTFAILLIICLIEPIAKFAISVRKNNTL